jgi:transcriptional accessory protein Tex/SPT6
MLDDVATVPFIARNRKEVSGAVDAAQWRALEEPCGICASWRNGAP